VGLVIHSRNGRARSAWPRRPCPPSQRWHRLVRRRGVFGRQLHNVMMW